MVRTIFFVLCSAWIALADDGKGDVRLFPDIPVATLDTDNVLCRNHFEMYADHLRNLSLWAHEMRDATAKSVTGILRGSISQFGQFEECLTSKAPFPTQYCLATIIANVPRQIPDRNPKSLLYEPNESVLQKIYDKGDPSQQPENVVLMGWCVPASCNPANLQSGLNRYFERVDFSLKSENVTYSSVVDESSCQKENEYKEYDQVDISFGLVTCIIVSVVIMSTVYDFCRDTTFEKLKERSPTVELLVAFSLRKNYRKLPSANDSNPAMKLLYGMRVICICMIIMDHKFGTHLASGILNFDIVENQYRSPVGSIFFHGDVFVDSFFILSGILVTYTLLIQYDRRFLNPAVIIFMRYVRLTPLYAMVIFYYATMLKYTGAGPMWKKIIVPEVEDCRTNWWTNLLYISNYVDVDNMCMVHSWYLPCDFHYFIIAIVLCIIIHKSKKIGLSLLGFVTFLTVLVPFMVVYLLDLSAVIYFYPDFLREPKQQKDFILAYSKSHMRAAPYFIGMIAGYLYYRMRGSGKCLKVAYSHAILFVSLLIMIGSVITGTIFYNPTYEYNPLESAFYASMHRVVWALGSVGVLYVASFGHAKFIYRFLSWRPWVPLSKLVYGAYLVHMQFQLRATARKGGADVTTYFDVMSSALSDIVLAFGTAFILYLFIEAPFRNIFSLLLAHPKSNRHSKENSETPENISESTCDSHL